MPAHTSYAPTHPHDNWVLLCPCCRAILFTVAPLGQTARENYLCPGQTYNVTVRATAVASTVQLLLLLQLLLLPLLLLLRCHVLSNSSDLPSPRQVSFGPSARLALLTASQGTFSSPAPTPGWCVRGAVVGIALAHCKEVLGAPDCAVALLAASHYPCFIGFFCNRERATNHTHAHPAHSVGLAARMRSYYP